MITLQVHNLRHTMATEPGFIDAKDRKDGGASFWHAEILFINDQGERQEIRLYGPTRESVTVSPFSVRVLDDDSEEEDTPLAASVGDVVG